ncbi:periplasmic heavy metal sensor [bacterium]|nr:periplasmic heavy metal sensor [bacterium]
MKTIKITLLAIFTLIGVSGMAQEKTKHAERQARTDAFLTEQLALTDAEQKAFLPLYKQYKAELMALRKASKVSKKKGKIMSELNDQELEEVIQASFDDKQKMLDIKKKYHGKFKKVISMKKVAKLYHVEKRMGKHKRGGKNRKGAKGKRNNKKTGEKTLERLSPTIAK